MILLIALQKNCQWISTGAYLTQNKQFSFSQEENCHKYSGGFVQKQNDIITTANFLNCVKEGSYITLNNASSQAEYYKYFESYYQMFFITFDLIFFGTWNELDNLTYSINNQNYNWIYNNSFQKDIITNGFCDNKSAFILTVNFTINQISIKGYHQFNVFTQSGNVSIKNFIYSGLICHPSCKKCWGSSPNQCSQCYEGTVKIENTCINQCPAETPFFVKQQGFKQLCPIDQLLYINGYCDNIQGILLYF